MKKGLLVSLLLLVAGSAAPLATAQVATSPFTAPEYYASSFNLWSLNGQSPNTYIFQGRSLCNSSAQGNTFFDFSTTAPVWIVDSNSASSEVVTPSSVTNTAGSCGITISPSNTHYSFQLRSGTAGLQEAINNLKDQSAWPAVVDLDRNWYVNANQITGKSASGILGAATGDATVIVKDLTTAGTTSYVWNGTAYASGTWSNAKPTIAAGAAAGTSPTVSNAATSTALVTTANVTTGTATTTGTLFTETWASSGQFQYAGTCSVSSVGTNSFTAFTVATSYASSQRTLTVTATSAPTASTAYVFSVNCK